MRLCVLLLLEVLATVAFAQSPSDSTSTSTFANSTTSKSSASTPSQSQCEICRNTGDCSKAYKGAAGKFCNSWLDPSSNRHACCCPASDVCSSDNTYECTCQRKSNNHWIWIGLGVFIVGTVIGGGVFMAIRKRRIQQRGDGNAPGGVGVTYAQQPEYNQGGYTQQGYGPGAYTQPVYAQGGYAQPTYVQQGYGNGGYGDGDRHNGRRGMGTAGAVAMGAAGGLLGGLLIGEAIGDMNDGGGDMGGGEFAGDF
ncbi:unnamed protein product [Peronospora destructor]|uniref:Uncharacterized protein n=1 Tax=Peronospora destructor TaxID=86335 RepID=A0AAV0VDX1_9STRA|nr:unnamed protein product [Peronospora destructor]